MKWIRLYSESSDVNTIPVDLTTREIKVIQNYLTKGKSLTDPQNKECLDIVLKMLNKIVNDSGIEEIEISISSHLLEKYGIEMDIDPFGKNSGIELSDNGLIELSHTSNEDLKTGGKYSDMIKGGFWDNSTDELDIGFISVEDMNKILKTDKIDDVVKSIQLKKDGNMARIMMNI